MFVHPPDDIGQQVGGGEHHYLVHGFLQWDGIADNDLIEGCFFQAFVSVTRQDGVCAESPDAGGTLVHDDLGGLSDGAGRVNDIIDEDDVASFHIAQQGHLSHLIGLGTLLIEDHHVGAEDLGIGRGPFYPAGVGGGDGDIGQVKLFDIRYEDGRGI